MVSSFLSVKERALYYNAAEVEASALHHSGTGHTDTVFKRIGSRKMEDIFLPRDDFPFPHAMQPCLPGRSLLCSIIVHREFNRNAVSMSLALF